MVLGWADPGWVSETDQPVSPAGCGPPGKKESGTNDSGGGVKSSDAPISCVDPELRAGHTWLTGGQRCGTPYGEGNSSWNQVLVSHWDWALLCPWGTPLSPLYKPFLLN